MADGETGDVAALHTELSDIAVEVETGSGAPVAAGETLEADLRDWVWKGPIVGGRVANVMLHVPYERDFACRVEQVVVTGLYHVERIAIAYRREANPTTRRRPPISASRRSRCSTTPSPIST